MSYILDGVTLAKPKQFRREYIPIVGNTKAINGKDGRDTRLVTKESYILSWEILSPAELSDILTIVAKNTPVNFSVDDSNLIIESTSVIIRIGSIGYSILGSSYIAKTSLELVEVQ